LLLLQTPVKTNYRQCVPVIGIHTIQCASYWQWQL